MQHQPSFLDRIACRLAYWHGQRVHRRFLSLLSNREAAQVESLKRALHLVGPSSFGRKYGLDRVRTADEFRRAVPLLSYEDLWPFIERACQGDIAALFRPGTRIEMFATTSGTTAQPKYIPVTPDFITDYRRGWNTFGLKLLSDHREAILRPILQSSGRYDSGRTAAGIPHGAITGLVARTQKPLVRRYYVGRPEIAELPDPAARYYTLMRLAAVRDVAWAITANPATLITMARIADDHSETLIRDVRDGTLSPELVADGPPRRALAALLRPDVRRATELGDLRKRHGRLLPRNMWNLSFVVCWIGGSMGHYLGRLRELWGDIPIRDPGLLASEGRVTIPFEDNVSIGVLDLSAGFFEFIPMDELDRPNPATLTADALQVGQNYAVVLTNTAGLVRYRLNDVVRMHGWLHQAPLLEFLYRAGRVSSIAGEKLTENQVVAAAQAACVAVQIPDFDFVLAPLWGEPPSYRMNAAAALPEGFVAAFDTALCRQNEEYESRRKSFRLGELQIRPVKPDRLAVLDRNLCHKRGAPAEQYKRPVLLTSPGEDDELLNLS